MKKMKNYLRVLVGVCLLWAAPLGAQEIVSGVTVVYPPGSCTGEDKLIEIGTVKPELAVAGRPEVVWTRNPRQFVEPCGTSIEKEFAARFRIRARCVDRETKAPLGLWVPSFNSLTRPWPEECTHVEPSSPQVFEPQP